VKFSISIVCHNRLDCTKKCLDSVIRNSTDYEIIVADNASTDGTWEYLGGTKWPCPMKTVRNAENVGFIRPQNSNLKLASGQYFVVLNNDVEVPAGWLEMLEKKFQGNPKMAVVGPRGGCQTLGSDGTGYGGPTLDYIEGSCLMIPTELARKYGLFSEEFKFGWYEDSDLSLRMRQIGYGIAKADFAVTHAGSATANIVAGKIDLDGIKLRNRLFFYEKWRSYLERRTLSNRILIDRMGAMGDVLLLTPILKAFRQKNPTFDIHIVSQYGQTLARNPNAKLLEAKRTKPDSFYDRVYDLNLGYEKFPRKHIVKAYADLCGVEVTDYRPEMFPSVDDESWADSFVPRLKKPFAVFHTGITCWPGRNWTAAGFQKVADYFQAKGYATVLVGNQATPAIKVDMDLRNLTTVHKLYSLFKRAKFFVGIDSLPMHLAVAANIPVTAVFGCISPEYRLPPGDPKFRGVTADGVECLGCHHLLPSPRVDSMCLRGNPVCMQKIDPAKVIAAAEAACAGRPV